MQEPARFLGASNPCQLAVTLAQFWLLRRSGQCANSARIRSRCYSVLTVHAARPSGCGDVIRAVSACAVTVSYSVRRPRTGPGLDVSGLDLSLYCVRA